MVGGCRQRGLRPGRPRGPRVTSPSWRYGALPGERVRNVRYPPTVGARGWRTCVDGGISARSSQCRDSLKRLALRAGRPNANRVEGEGSRRTDSAPGRAPWAVTRGRRNVRRSLPGGQAAGPARPRGATAACFRGRARARQTRVPAPRGNATPRPRSARAAAKP